MSDASLHPKRLAPMEVSSDQFRAAGYQLIDRIADLLAGIRERPLTTGESASEVRRLISSECGLPEEGGDFASLVAQAAEWLMEHSLYNGHPKFLGYVTSSPAPIGMLADLLAAAVNPNVGAWRLSPVATEIESQTVRWIAELLGYPAGCSGLLVSGGNVANHVGFYAALRSVFPRASVSNSPSQLARATVYASPETHTWLEKAVDMFGFGPGALRSIEVDSERRLRADDLEARLTSDLKEGCIPVAVVGNAGTVSTGAVDPLPAIARVCRENKVWFHVDGAYGGFAVVAHEAPEDLRGLTLADSLAVDPHKWLYAPLEAGCALVRDPLKHRAAYHYLPSYYHFDNEVTNFFDYGPQNSRGFRALKVWLGLRQVGRSGYCRMISDDMALARRLFQNLGQDPRFEVQSLGLSIVTFRYVPDKLHGLTAAAAEDYLNRLNRALQERLEVGGEVFVSNAVMDGRYLLRACIVNFRTSARDIDEVPEIIARHGNEIHRERRASVEDKVEPS